MQNKIAALVKVIKHCNVLMKKTALNDSEITLIESINKTIAHLENKLDRVSNELLSCGSKDYAELDKLLSILYFSLRQYILDVERFDGLWFQMWSNYYKLATTDNFINIKIEKIPEDILMFNVFQRILKILIRLNRLDGKTIVYKKELDIVADGISEYPDINKKLHAFIDAAIHRDKNDTESTTGYFLYIGGKIGTYLCILKQIEQTMQKTVQAYSEKAEVTEYKQQHI